MIDGKPLETCYITERALTSLARGGYLVDIVALADPFRKASFWYGEWTIQLPEQRGESERFFVTMRLGTGPRLRTFNTANDLISMMVDLGFEDVRIPMEAGRSATHQIKPLWTRRR